MNGRAMFRFRLYFAHDLETSAQALRNLKAMCRTHLPGRHEIEIVNVYQESKRMLAEGILMTPTLVRLTPAPPKKIVGTLARTDLVLQVLGIDTQPEAELA